MTVLALRALGLGDLLTGVPALRALRRTGDPVLLAAPAGLAPLVRLAGVSHLPTEGLVPVAAHRPALAVNLHGVGPRSTDLLRATGPGALWAFGPGGPQWRAGEHEVERWCRLLAWYGVAADPADLALPVPDVPSPAPGAVLVHPGAAAGSRRWPVDRYAAVAAALAADGHRVVATAGPGESAAAVGVETVTPSLESLAALVAGAALVVCGDTGVAHLATAYGTPSVLLFGPTPPAEWGPRSGPHTVLWAGGTGDPHGADPDPGLLAIDTQQVIDAARGRVRAAVAP